MTTRGDMVDEIENDLERSDEAAIIEKISAAIRHYQRTRFFFNETRSVTFDTVASQGLYTFSAIGTEFYRIDAVYVTDSGEEYELYPAAYTDLEALDGTSETEARPTEWAYIARSMRLWATPDDVYSMRIAGHFKLDGPESDDEDGNPWMNEAYDLIKARAKVLLFAMRYRDEAGAALERVAEQDALRTLLGDTAAKVSQGRLEPTDF